MFINFLRTVQLLHINFLQKFLVLFWELPNYKELFTASPPPLRAILRYFKAHFGVCFSILASCSILSYETFYLCFFKITMIVNMLKKFHSRYPSAGGITQYFLAYFGYIPQCLEKLKTSPWHSSQMSLYYCGSHWTKKGIWPPSALSNFGCFWSVLWFISQTAGNH